MLCLLKVPPDNHLSHKPRFQRHCMEQSSVTAIPSQMTRLWVYVPSVQHDSSWHERAGSFKHIKLIPLRHRAQSCALCPTLCRVCPNCHGMPANEYTNATMPATRWGGHGSQLWETEASKREVRSVGRKPRRSPSKALHNGLPWHGRGLAPARPPLPGAEVSAVDRTGPPTGELLRPQEGYPACRAWELVLNTYHGLNSDRCTSVPTHHRAAPPKRVPHCTGPR